MESIEDFDILGVRLVDPVHNLDEEQNLYVRKGIIYHEKPSSMPEKKFQLNGLVVVPGLLDLRVHTRVPGGENIENIAPQIVSEKNEYQAQKKFYEYIKAKAEKMK